MIKNKRFLFLLISLCVSFLLSCHSVLACRMLLLMASEKADQKQEKTLINSLLLKDRMSLLNQSKIGQKHKYNNITTLEDVDGLYVKMGNPDGWGIVQYKDNSLESKIKSSLPAYEDPFYFKTVKEAVKNPPDIMMAHVRLTMDKNSVYKKNVHPFVYKEWSFMHNGTVDYIDASVITNKMSEYQNRFDLYPKGDTDSEAIFYYFLGKMAEKRKQLNVNDLSQGDIVGSFVSMVLDMRKYSKINFREFMNEEAIYEGKCLKSPTMNFMATNGNLILVYKHKKDLYLGLIKNRKSDHPFVIISSEVMLSPSQKDVQWHSIPDESLLIIDRKTHNIKMFPVETFLQH